MWSNTCCSHPYSDKSINDYATLRLVQEMGIETNLKEVFSFIYKTNFENGLVEYEYDHVFFGKYNSDPTLNIDEASDFRWINFKQLLLEIAENPTKFTFWLKKIVQDYSLYFLDSPNLHSIVITQHQNKPMTKSFSVLFIHILWPKYIL